VWEKCGQANCFDAAQNTEFKELDVSIIFMVSSFQQINDFS
jgi:hypothetical protein